MSEIAENKRNKFSPAKHMAEQPSGQPARRGPCGQRGPAGSPSRQAQPSGPAGPIRVAVRVKTLTASLLPLAAGDAAPSGARGPPGGSGRAAPAKARGHGCPGGDPTVARARGAAARPRRPLRVRSPDRAPARPLRLAGEAQPWRVAPQAAAPASRVRGTPTAGVPDVAPWRRGARLSGSAGPAACHGTGARGASVPTACCAAPGGAHRQIRSGARARGTLPLRGSPGPNGAYWRGLRRGRGLTRLGLPSGPGTRPW